MRKDDERDYVEYMTSRLARLHRTALLLCGDPSRADDLVQATALTAYMKWKQVRGAENVDAYIHRILVRKHLDERRLRWSQVRLLEALPERAAPPSDAVEQRDAVCSALAQLSRGQRTAVVLRYFCDLTVEATAAAMGCSAGNVKSQTSRGLTTLRQILAPDRRASTSGLLAVPSPRSYS